jgi:hypothetical protein
MSRWLARAALFSSDVATPSTDRTDESTCPSSDPGLLSVVSGRRPGVFPSGNGHVSVLSVPMQGAIDDTRPGALGERGLQGCVWSDRETRAFLLRHAQFRALGLSDALAESLADRLVVRDRDGDDRRLCAECRHCRLGSRCTKQFAVLDVLQRCDHFTATRP